MEDNLVIRLFSDCVVTKGYRRSTLVDLQKNTFHYIPNALAFLLEAGGFNISSERSKLEEKDHKVFDEYIDFILANGLGFLTQEENSLKFGREDFDFQTPAVIENCVADVESSFAYDVEILVDKLAKLRCKFLQIRMFSGNDFSYLEDIYERIIKDSSLRGVEILFPYYDDLDLIQVSKFLAAAPRIYRFVIYGFPNELVPKKEINARLLFSSEKSISIHSCGKIGYDLFAITRKGFYESMHKNSCLYKKISIDVEGYVRNCPSLPAAYGKIEHLDIQDLIDKSDFTQYWNIKKDLISTCKDCEFRHICTDCRAYLEDPTDLHSKPLKCGYDPYTCQWEDWRQQNGKDQIMNEYKASYSIL